MEAQGDPILLVRDSFKRYIEAVLQHLTELQRRWDPCESVLRGMCRSSGQQVEELAALCRECGLASAKAVVACDRVLRRAQACGVQERAPNSCQSRAEDQPPTTNKQQELQHRMATLLQYAYRRYRLRCQRRKLSASKALGALLTRWQMTKLQESLRQFRHAGDRRRAAAVIARAARGWLAQRCACRAEQLFHAVRSAERVRTLRLMRRYFTSWIWKLDFSWRWAKRKETVSLESDDVRDHQCDFWQLFPSEGKNAVAKAQSAWFKKRMAWLAWVRTMCEELKIQGQRPHQPR
ncbi:unnamed protein product [Symbiodinium pilosum]|uniref:Uncharacterized protein n=1 Tax=Symbiodinium pilosum TaxID=2952 RepID=A0A812LB25_SYMPI|nr:unnamed protein product [Symbiodinium pilosum]